jgi:hypothetical protein
MKLLIISSVIFQFTVGTPIEAKGTSKSMGFLTGNIVQVLANIPINDCGNGDNIIGVGNGAAGNTCTNTNSHV